MVKKAKVVVAMSGGVDSSLTAALLVQQGYDVIGVTMRLADESRDFDPLDDRGCCTLKSVDDARRVADTIGIPHYVMNFRDMFQKKVIDYFIDEYARGHTPNPCIACNRYVKFEGLLQRSLALDAEFLATGHYARIEQDSKTGRYLLCKGMDTNKDQSYALYHLNQSSLKHFMLPLGGYTKVETRRLAAELNLSVADKPDSQEICFIPNDDYKSYLKEKVPKAIKPGNIIDINGNILGRHQGVPFYTIGQRKGLGIAAKAPLYVVDLNLKKNVVIVGEAEDVFAPALIAKDLNWISIDGITEPLTVKAKVRYGPKESSATVLPIAADVVKVVFDQPQRAVTPGQSIVFYDGDCVVGGGVIVRSLRNKDEV